MNEITAISERTGALEARLAEVAARAEAAEQEQFAALARISALTIQRDVALASSRRATSAMSAAEAQWREQVAKLEQRADAAELQAAEWQVRAVEWQQRYEGLRSRLARLLSRFGITLAIRLVPTPTRRFVRSKILGWRAK